MKTELTLKPPRDVRVICHPDIFTCTIFALNLYRDGSNQNTAMSQPAQDRQPLLPTHTASSSRLSRPKISFPSATTSALAPAEDAEAGQHAAPTRRWSREPRVEGQKQGLPKLSRECLWR